MSKQELERIDDLGMAAWDNHKPDAFADLFADEFVLRDHDCARAAADGCSSGSCLRAEVPHPTDRGRSG